MFFLGIILEDDSRVKTKFKDYINDKILKETKPHNAGAAGYIISKEFAKYMYDHLHNFKYPHDMYMGYNTMKKTHLTLEMKMKQVVMNLPYYFKNVPVYGTGKSTEAKTVKQIVKENKYQ